jgi:eukaryotic-like serine/threonine-protein kinase
MLQLGEILEGKYRILRLLGEGGMGSVFEGEAVRLRRRVAIKVLRHEAASENDSEIAARFELEAQAAGRIGSRHIVDVLDLGRLPSGAHFMVMEYLDGESLRSRIASSAPMAPAALYPILMQLLEGVGAAHSAQVIHRDLKPDNVFLVKQADGRDFVKLLDFGISKFHEADLAMGEGLGLTRTGAMMGTPYYLAPEQANGASQTDERTDLYALGVVLYECLTGSVPYSASGFNELLFRIVLEQPTPILQLAPGADPAFVALVERAMHKAPAERFQTASEMGRAFHAWANGLVYEAPCGVVRTPGSTGRPSARPSQNTPQVGGATVADDKLTSNPALEPWSHSQLSGALDESDAPRRRGRRWAWLAIGCVAVAGAAALVHWGLASPVPPTLSSPTSATPASAAAPPTTAHVEVAPSANAEPDLLAAPDAERLPMGTADREPAVLPRSSTQTQKARRSFATAGKPAGGAAVAPTAQPVPAEAAPADSDLSRIRGGRTIRTDL